MKPLSRRSALRGAVAAGAVAALPVGAASHDKDAELVALWEKRNRLMEAFYAADEAALEAKKALPENIWKGPIVTVTTPSGATGECRTEADIRRLYSSEGSRHPRFKQEAWPDELRAAYARCDQIDHSRLTDDDVKARQEYHRLQMEHDRAVSIEILAHRDESLAALECERARCNDARERAGIPALEAKAEEFDGEAWELERRITEIKASTTTGLAIQAKLLCSYMEAGEIADQRDLRLARSMLASLDRMAKGGAS